MEVFKFWILLSYIYKKNSCFSLPLSLTLANFLQFISWFFSLNYLMKFSEVWKENTQTFLAMFFFENETFLAMLVTFSGQLWKQNNKIMLASFLDVMFLFIYLFLNKNYIWWLRLTGQSTCIGKVCSFYINCILSNLSFSSDQPPIYYRIT